MHRPCISEADGFFARGRSDRYNENGSAVLIFLLQTVMMRRHNI